MPRRRRTSTGGYVYHVLNRAVGRDRIFETAGDFGAFERILDEVRERIDTRLLAYTIMPNHWHLLLWPSCDGDLSEYMRLVTVTHTQRWHAAHGTSGTGPLYQGRFKSFPVQEDDHFYAVCRYVERNPLRANLVEAAESWRWGSLWAWRNRSQGATLAKWPVPRPRDWCEYVNGIESEAELAAIRQTVKRGAPFGEATWQSATARRLSLESTLRSRGRPRSQRSRKR